MYKRDQKEKDTSQKIIDFLVAYATIMATIVSLLAWLFPAPLAQIINLNFITPVSVQSSTGEQTIPQPQEFEIVSSEKFTTPWTQWLIQLLKELPKESWGIILFSLAILFLVIGFGAIYQYRRFVNTDNDIQITCVTVLSAIIIAFLITYPFLKWWGMLIGLLLGTGVWVTNGGVVTETDSIFPKIVAGGIAGLFLVNGGVLSYSGFTRAVIESYYFIGSIIGACLGIGLLLIIRVKRRGYY
jgi:hypothetical protein